MSSWEFQSDKIRGDNKNSLTHSAVQARVHISVQKMYVPNSVIRFVKRGADDESPNDIRSGN